jgi:hypothetical protein
MPARLPEFQHGHSLVVRKVGPDGCVKWAGSSYFLSETLTGEAVGLQQISSCHWSIQLVPLEVTLLDEEIDDVLPYKHMVWLNDGDGA